MMASCTRVEDITITLNSGVFFNEYIFVAFVYEAIGAGDELVVCCVPSWPSRIFASTETDIFE